VLKNELGSCLPEWKLWQNESASILAMIKKPTADVALALCLGVYQLGAQGGVGIEVQRTVVLSKTRVLVVRRNVLQKIRSLPAR
jgi:hypothetical protein